MRIAAFALAVLIPATAAAQHYQTDFPAEEFNAGEMHRIEGRVRQLNALGFDVAELDITTDLGGSTIRIQPKVVDAGHRPVPLGGPRARELLALMLLNPNRPLSAERLVTALWGEGASEGAATTLRTHVATVRRVLAAAGVGETLTTHPSGYVLDLHRGDLDADVFEGLVHRGQEALGVGDPGQATAIRRTSRTRPSRGWRSCGWSPKKRRWPRPWRSGSIERWFLGCRSWSRHTPSTSSSAPSSSWRSIAPADRSTP